MADLKVFLKAEKTAGKAIYPPGREFFAALDATPPSQVRVVLIGQDPLPRCSSSTWVKFLSQKGAGHTAVTAKYFCRIASRSLDRPSNSW
jgi:uracil-DNA glycosylase